MPKSARRVLDIFELIARFPKGLTFTEIHNELRIPKSSLSALLCELNDRGYIGKNEIRQYVPGVRLMALGTIHIGARDLVEVADPLMGEMRDLTRETVNLAVLDQADVVFVHKKLAPQRLRYDVQVGSRMPAYASSVGKAILSTLLDKEIRALYPYPQLAGFTPNTLRTQEELIAELKEVRRRGFATDHQEGLIGVYAVGSPIFDQASKAIAALSIAYPSVRYASEFERKLAEIAIIGAQIISSNLGYFAGETILGPAALRGTWGA